MRKDAKAPKRNLSIGWKLAGYLTVFAAVILLITFVFQVLLLGTFFRAIKKSEIESTAQELLSVLGNGEAMKEVAYTAARERSLGVSVYRLDDTDPDVIVDVKENGMFLPVSREKLSQLYKRALENEGLYLSRVTFGGYEVEDQDFWDDFFSDNMGEKPHRVHPKTMQFLGIQVAKGENGAEYMLVISASCHPLDSTTRTLSIQYVWILAIVTVITVLMAWILYRRISKPLIRMTNAARSLASGRYDADFSGESGYRETRELANTLNYAAEELSRTDRLQKELIANISHDLRTPLTMIKGYGEVMRDIPGENTPENIQVIIDETTRLSALVNDLLDLSKMQAGSVVPNCAMLDMTDLIKESMGRYEAFTKHQGYRISFEAEQHLCVYADRSMMLQVLYNLVNNAINYTGEDKTVRILQEVKDGRVRISVEDTGEGIPQSEVKYIWDRYYKVDKVHQRAKVGTGLGLSIVKEILEAHGAAYGVQSTIGHGSVFWFELPITEQNTTEE